MIILETHMGKKYIIITLSTVIALTIAALILGSLNSIELSMWQSFRAVFGFVILIFVPGFIWSWAIWKPKSIDGIERITISTALSIVFVPFAIFVLSKLGVTITAVSTLLTVIGVSLIGIAVTVVRYKYKLIKKYFRRV